MKVSKLLLIAFLVIWIIILCWDKTSAWINWNCCSILASFTDRILLCLCSFFSISGLYPSYGSLLSLIVRSLWLDHLSWLILMNSRVIISDIYPYIFSFSIRSLTSCILVIIVLSTVSSQPVEYCIYYSYLQWSSIGLRSMIKAAFVLQQWFVVL